MYILGFDIGGTKCAAVTAEWDGEKVTLLRKVRLDTDTAIPPCEMIERLMSAADGILDSKPDAIGISSGGPLDSVRGVIMSPPNLPGWDDVHISEILRDHYGVRAQLLNDANACAVAEWKFGAGRGTQNMVFLTFGTGLGAGLILDGRLYSGTNGNAGEVGHLRLESDGPVGYNKAGSAEGFCSGGGIKRLAEIRAREQGIDLGGEISARLVFEKAKAGDSFFASVVKESAEKFARVGSMLIDLFNPQVIAAGGVFMRNYELFMGYMRPVIEAECLSDSYKVCRILPAEIGENIGDYAALAIAASED